MFKVKDKTPAFALFILLSMMICVQSAFAQQTNRKTYTVRGEILSLVDGLPLANIAVYLKGTDHSAYSDSNGVFEIKGVPAGTYDVIAKYPDFDATILKGVAVPPPAKKSFVFNLEPANNSRPLPYLTSPPPDSLGLIEGEIRVKIDAYSAAMENGRLLLKAAVAGDMRQGYLYPQKWKILPVDDQNFRFKFYLPKGKSYRLYLIWQEAREPFVYDRIIDVVRASDNPQAALLFDLSGRSIRSVRYTIDLVDAFGVPQANN